MNTPSSKREEEEIRKASGLSLNAHAHLFHQALLAELSHHNHPRLGDAVVAAQADYAATGAFPELLEIYHLLGDPALLLC